MKWRSGHIGDVEVTRPREITPEELEAELRLEAGLAKLRRAKPPEPKVYANDYQKTFRDLWIDSTNELAWYKEQFTECLKQNREVLDHAKRQTAHADEHRLKWIEMLQHVEMSVKHDISLEALEMALNYIAFDRVVGFD